jgi:hypothetical protein
MAGAALREEALRARAAEAELEAKLLDLARMADACNDRLRLEIREGLERLQTEIAKLRAQVTPPPPSMLLGRGYVRFARDGSLWALNRRERCFGEFGWRFTSWDELFRRLDVKVVEHGGDEHGPWWAIEPTPRRGGA